MNFYSSAEEFYGIGCIAGYAALFNFRKPLPGIEKSVRDYMARQGVQHVDCFSDRSFGIAVVGSEEKTADIAVGFLDCLASEYGEIEVGVGFSPVEDVFKVCDAYKRALNNSVKFSGRYEKAA